MSPIAPWQARRRRLVAGLLAGLLLTGGSTGAMAQSSVIRSGNGSCRDIALTYDNAEFNGDTGSLLDTLDSLHLRATFFLLGGAVDAAPALVRRIVDRHAIGNHTMTHPHMTTLSAEEMRTELTQAEAAITRVAGRSPLPLFRPPYGEYNDTLLNVAGAAGYTYTVMWAIDTIDWEYPPPQTIRQRIVERAVPGAIVLMHGYLAGTVEGTRLAVPDLRHLGYQFVTVPEILGRGRDQRDFGGDTYVVQSGDTMGHIGACHNLTGPRLQAYNAVTTVPPGYVLNIPHRTEVIITVDGSRQDCPVYPRLQGDRVLAPVRLAEALGATVSWDGARVTIVKGTTQLQITPTESAALVNGLPVDMGATAFMVSDRVLAPVRFLAEQLGARVTWDGLTWTVGISRGTMGGPGGRMQR